MVSFQEFKRAMTNGRELISMEQGMELLNRNASSLNVVVVSRIKGFLSEAVLRHSLDLLQNRHPLLNCHIVGSLKRMNFKSEGTKKIPLNTIINSKKNFWKAVVNHELQTKIESDKVLVRFTLIKSHPDSNSSCLISTAHHAITDAISSLNLHSETINYCQLQVSEKKILETFSLLEIPSLESLISKNIPKSLGFERPIQKPDTIPFEKYVNHQQRYCRFVQKQLDSELTNQLIKFCKTERVTVHGYICAAMMLALAEELEYKNKYFDFSCRSSVDMRRRINPPVSSEYFAMLVSALTSFHRVTRKQNIWQLAREVTQQIKNRLKTPEIYNVILSYRKGTEYILKHPEKTAFSVFVTNVGKIDITSEFKNFEIEEISYFLPTTIMGNVFGASISTFKGKITFNFLFSRPLIGEGLSQSLVKKTLSYFSLSNN